MGSRRPAVARGQVRDGAVEVRVAKDDNEAARLATARRSAFSALARVAPTTILEDATVPRSRIGWPGFQGFRCSTIIGCPVRNMAMMDLTI